MLQARSVLIRQEEEIIQDKEKNSLSWLTKKG